MILDFFYSGQPTCMHSITDEHIEVIRKLRFRMGKSAYYSPMPIWSFSDNEDLLKEKGLTIKEIWKSTHFITLLGTSNNMPAIFERLLRQLYLNEDEEGGFITGYKRPFGNSNVLGDVRYELIHEGFYGNLTDEEEEALDEDYKEEQKVLESFMKWLTEDFLKNFEIKFRAFEFADTETRFSKTPIEYWANKGVNNIPDILHSWRLDKSESRNQKLKSIGI